VGGTFVPWLVERVVHWVGLEDICVRRLWIACLFMVMEVLRRHFLHEDFISVKISFGFGRGVIGVGADIFGV
jgi:hypothetical protein